MWVRILKRTLFTQSLNGWMNECLPWTCERDSNHILTNNVQVRKTINGIKTITSLSRRASFNRHNKSVYVVEWMKLTYIILNFSSVHDFITNKSESFSLRSICLVENVVFFRKCMITLNCLHRLLHRFLSLERCSNWKKRKCFSTVVITAMYRKRLTLKRDFQRENFCIALTSFLLHLSFALHNAIRFV